MALPIPKFNIYWLINLSQDSLKSTQFIQCRVRNENAKLRAVNCKTTCICLRKFRTIQKMT